MKKHPITPPDELVMEWINKHYGGDVRHGVCGVERTIATQASRWGADMELDACLEWMAKEFPREAAVLRALRAARRPKPPSLKERALELVDRIEKAESVWAMSELNTIRRALEALPD